MQGKVGCRSMWEVDCKSCKLVSTKSEVEVWDICLTPLWSLHCCFLLREMDNNRVAGDCCAYIVYRSCPCLQHYNMQQLCDISKDMVRNHYEPKIERWSSFIFPTQSICCHGNNTWHWL